MTGKRSGLGGLALWGLLVALALGACGSPEPTIRPQAAATPAPTAPAARSEPTRTEPTPTASSQATGAAPATPTLASKSVSPPPVATTPSAPAQAVDVEVGVVATRLDTPWALAFAPDGRLFVTERPGRLRLIENGRLRDQPIATLPVQETAEGGLMGLALHPDFPREPYLYVMYTYSGERGLRNRIARLRFDDSSAREDSVLLDNLPAGSIHDGGRLKIGPDRLLYATLGEVGDTSLAQNPSSPAGKILRLNLDGTPPAGNPFPGSHVYTLGHRNPEGLAFRWSTGRLYSTEHGPTGNDEVNLIEAGQNYGWPRAQGADHPAPYRSPIATYSPSIAPSGATFYYGSAIPQWTGSLFFTTLRGEHLRRLVIDEADSLRVLADERLYQGQYGRLRDVAEGPGGVLYVATSNRDGRGSPSEDDDRILRIAPRPPG